MLTHAAIALLFAVQASPLDVDGVWLTDEQDSKVEISACEDGTPCGRVVWVAPQSLEPERRGTVLKDGNNPDRNLQERPIIGMTLIEGFERDDERWRKGTIYDPKGGKEYRSTLKRVSEDELEVQGCIAFLCRELVWTKSNLTDADREEAAEHAPVSSR